jgi:hypothetical protein
MYAGIHANYPLFLSNFNEIFLTDVEKYQMSDFMKIIAVGVEFHVEGRTDREV